MDELNALLARARAAANRRAARGGDRAAMSEREKAENLLASLVSAGVPRRIRETIALGVRSEWEKRPDWPTGDFCGPVVLAGAVGCGKSTTAGIWLHARLSELAHLPVSIPECWIPAHRLAEPKEDVGWASRVRWLVVDDVGTEYLGHKAYARARIETILSERYHAQRPTLLTTNLSLGDFRKRYGARVWDRLRETGLWMATKTGSLR